MKKLEFILALHNRLSGLPQEEAEERLLFYGEMIDDRMEEGMTEEEAVAAIGSVDAIVQQILADIPLSSLAKQWVKPKRRLSGGEILMLVLGSPIWLSLLIAAFAVVLSVYVALWAVVASLWAVPVSLAGTAIGGAILSVMLLAADSGAICAAYAGLALLCAGLAIFSFFGVRATTKGAVWLSRKGLLAIKNCFVKGRGRHE